MLSQYLSVKDTIPLTISMNEGKKTFSNCLLMMRIIRGRRIPERMLGMRPSPFVSCYWSYLCNNIFMGDYPPAFNQESELLENQGVLFHTEEVIKDTYPE